MQQNGFFGRFGGQFVPPELKRVLDDLAVAYEQIAPTDEFKQELNELLINYAGRPSPLYFARNLSEHFNQNIYLKREDLNHTGAHKINHALGQGLLAKKMGKKRIIAETGAGQHGVASATVAALLGLECTVFMGECDIQRQALNVYKMRLLGAKVISVATGRGTLSDAVDAAIKAWIEDTGAYYLLGSAVGPHPYPTIVRDFQSVISKEVKLQCKEKNINPDILIACVGGGSNAIGLFSEYIGEKSVRLIGVEAAGLGADTPYHAATMTKGKEGVIHGMNTIVLTEPSGDISPVHSISAGLDYPGVGPEHAYLKDSGRAEYYGVTDDECIEALKLCTKLEGIIPAIESSHALAYLPKICAELNAKNERKNIIVNVSGRGDKDMQTVMEYKKGEIYG